MCLSSEGSLARWLRLRSSGFKSMCSNLFLHIQAKQYDLMDSLIQWSVEDQMKWIWKTQLWSFLVNS